jgi:hypothetical protein
MNYTDEELQQQIEQGATPNEGIDTHAYQKVFTTLKREPAYSLPFNFADRVVGLVDAKEKSAQTWRDNLWLGLGLLSFLFASVVAIVLTGFRFSVGAFQFLSSYPGLIIFGLAFILLLNWMDKKIIRNTTTS